MESLNLYCFIFLLSQNSLLKLLVLQELLLTDLSNKMVMLIAFYFGQIWVRPPINHNLIQHIEYFPRHCLPITEDFTVEAHSQSYVNTLYCVISMEDLSQVFSVAFKLEFVKRVKYLISN